MKQTILFLLFLSSPLVGYQPAPQEDTAVVIESDLPKYWEKIAQFLQQAQIDSLQPYMSGEAWGQVLHPDIQYWTAYEIKNQAVAAGKGLLQVQFHELRLPMVLMFCKQQQHWVFQGLYLRHAGESNSEGLSKANWYYQDDWERVLEQGRWPQYLKCGDE